MFLYLPYEYSNEYIVDCFGRTVYLHRIHYSEPVVDGHHHWNSFWSADIEAVSFGTLSVWYAGAVAPAVRVA